MSARRLDDGTAICRTCTCTFEPTAHQISKSDFLCVPCCKAYNRAVYERRKAAGVRVSGTRVSREHYRNWNVDYKARPEVRERKRLAAAARRTDPVEAHKQSVRRQTRHAIARGDLTRQPCEVCGAVNVDAHHDDYSKPLEVRWLCRVHHSEFHAKAKGIAA